MKLSKTKGNSMAKYFMVTENIVDDVFAPSNFWCDGWLHKFDK